MIGCPGAERAVRPPSCNTGVEITGALVHVPRSEFAVHWLQGTGNYDAYELIEDFSRHLGQENWEARDRGLFGYRASFASSDGLQIHTAPSTSGMPECLVIASGETCEALGWERVRLLAMWGLNLTRVDLAFDHGDVSPREFKYFWEHGYARSRVHRASCSYHESPDGTTFYMGAPGGLHRLVVYDRRGFNRAELRLKRERAHALLERGFFSGTAAEAAVIGLGSLRDLVDFVDPSSDKNVSRRSLLPWWERWLSGAARAFVKLPARVASSLASRFVWLRDQVAPTLARVVDTFGRYAANQLVAEGRRRNGVRAERADAAVLRARWLAGLEAEGDLPLDVPRGAMFPGPERGLGYYVPANPLRAGQEFPREERFFRVADPRRVEEDRRAHPDCYRDMIARHLFRARTARRAEPVAAPV